MNTKFIEFETRSVSNASYNMCVVDTHFDDFICSSIFFSFVFTFMLALVLFAFKIQNIKNDCDKINAVTPQMVHSKYLAEKEKEDERNKRNAPFR